MSSANPTTHGRKRRFDDDTDDHMTTSSLSPRTLARPSKKLRSNDLTGRPLSLPRLLETLDADSLRSVLQHICEQRPDIGRDVVAAAPRPSVDAALAVLGAYQEKLRAAFPYGDDTASEYAYNRVRPALAALVDAVADFTPHYLPPQEAQVALSCAFLDGATKVVHALPDWRSAVQRYHKERAYEEMGRAWQLVIVEAGKRGAGIQVSYGGWDQKLREHDAASGGRLAAAVAALGSQMVWGRGSGGGTGDFGGVEQGQRERIRNELLNGTYGSGIPLRVGPW